MGGGMPGMGGMGVEVDLEAVTICLISTMTTCLILWINFNFVACLGVLDRDITLEMKLFEPVGEVGTRNMPLTEIGNQEKTEDRFASLITRNSIARQEGHGVVLGSYLEARRHCRA